MIALSDDERNYLRAAFADSPRQWFLPGSVAWNRLSDQRIDVIVEELARRGLMDAQPGCHARLTNQGRKVAVRMQKLASRGGPNFRHRPAVTAAVVCGILLLCLIVVSRLIRVF